MKAVVVSHGLIQDIKYAESIIKDCDLIVCADGGAEYLQKCKIYPHVLIGDLDSIEENALSDFKAHGCRIIKYPREKDFTDTQLAADYAAEHGANEIIMLGCIGSRLDHSLANIMLMVALLKKGIFPCIINEKNKVYITDSIIKLEGKPGDLVSLIPVGGDVTGIYTEGLEYGLSNSTIRLGDTLGISNVFLKDYAQIKICSGCLLIIKSID